jgi:hypothetical protein
MTSKVEKRKNSIQQALEFSSKACPNFIFEDTNDRSYRDFVEIFESNGWTKVPYRKRSKVEKKR